MSTESYRAALIRKIEKEMDRIDAEEFGTHSFSDQLYSAYEDGIVQGQQRAYSHVLWLIKDAEDL
jgi:hypothetical protein